MSQRDAPIRPPMLCQTKPKPRHLSTHLCADLHVCEYTPVRLVPVSVTALGLGPQGP